MPSLLALTVAASSATAVTNFAGWWFVWKHEDLPPPPERRRGPDKKRHTEVEWSMNGFDKYQSWDSAEVAKETALDKALNNVFWIGFSYLFPLMPALIAMMGPDGAATLPENFTFAFVMVLSVTLGVLMTGLSISNYGWIRRDNERAARQGETTPSTLPETAKKHLYWTTFLTALVAALWWYIVFG